MFGLMNEKKGGRIAWRVRKAKVGKLEKRKDAIGMGPLALIRFGMEKNDGALYR